MANVTFSSPEYKDRTIYAVAGSHTKTLLMIAQENKVPIPFDCENGECGSCVIKVKQLDKGGQAEPEKAPMGMHLTLKERTVLKELGKLTQDQIDDLITHSRPSEWRLACQFIVRDEDVLVEY